MTKIIRETHVSIPEGVEVQIQDTKVTIKGKRGAIEKIFYHPRLTINYQDKKLNVTCKEKTPYMLDKMMIHTFRAHLHNMIKGVQDGYTAKLKVCSGHFPITVTAEGNTLTIKNFLGEKNPRKAKLYPGVKAKVEGEVITLEGTDKEAVGQSAARIENATRITNRDRRIFQDGCYILLKPGEEQ